MRPLQNTESVWWYVTREFEQTLGRPVNDDEAVTVTLVVSALTKLVTDTENAVKSGVVMVPRRRASEARAGNGRAAGVPARVGR